MQRFTITPRLDEEDNSPVFEVKVGDYETNAVTLEDAFTIIRGIAQPAKTLEDIAREWVRKHGTETYEHMTHDVLKEAEVSRDYLTDDQIDSILNMIEHAEVIVSFPFGHGTN